MDVSLPRRILLTADAVGGVWTYALDLSRCLTQRGVDVLVAVIGPSPQTFPDDLRFVHRSGPLEWYPDASEADLAQTGDWLLAVAKTFEPDLVHLNGYCHAALDWGVPVLVAAHSCVYSWWEAVHGCNPPAEWQPYRERVIAGLDAASQIVAPSSAMLDALRRAYDLPLPDAAVIHNFSTVHFRTGVTKRPSIVACGRTWDKAKNFDLIERIAPSLSWPAHVHSNQSHAQILNELAHAGIFAHPAKYEPFGLAVLEAARSRCALVLSDIPSLRELWGDAAIFVPPDDADAWTATLNRVASDDELREDLSNRAFLHSWRYSAESTVHQYLEHYKALALIAATR